MTTRMRRGPLYLLLAAALPLAACGSPSTSDAGAEPAEAVEGSLDEVCAAGAEEGSFVFWDSEERETLQRLHEDFAESHPGIEMELQELRPEDIAQRLVTESAAGRDSGVDLVAGNLDAFVPLVERELMNTSIDWTAMGVPDNLITDTNAVRSSRIAGGLVYNTEALSESDLPETWEELVDERWAGTVVVDPRGNPLQSLALVWGEDEAIDYVRRLKEVVQPVVVEGGTAGMLTVASGENLLTTNGRSAETLEQQAQGSPLEIHYLDVIPTSDFYQVVVQGAPHPNAAACWVGWITGPEGSAAQLEYAFKHNDDVPPGAPEGAEIAAITTQEEVEVATGAASAISEIWTSQ